MAHGETVDRILRAATILFAERGFAETSLRTITGMADVNLAAVNYHFGTKKSLIQAIFTHFLNPFTEELNIRLDELERKLGQGEKPTAEQLVEQLFSALKASMETLNEEPQRFMRLLGLAYTQSQEHLRQHLSDSYGRTYTRYTKLLTAAVPHLDPIAFYWRINFMLGAMIFTLSSFESIQGILQVEHDVEMGTQDAFTLMVPALSGLLEKH